MLLHDECHLSSICIVQHRLTSALPCVHGVGTDTSVPRRISAGTKTFGATPSTSARQMAVTSKQIPTNDKPRQAAIETASKYRQLTDIAALPQKSDLEKVPRTVPKTSSNTEQNYGMKSRPVAVQQAQHVQMPSARLSVQAIQAAQQAKHVLASNSHSAGLGTVKALAELPAQKQRQPSAQHELRLRSRTSTATKEQPNGIATALRPSSVTAFSDSNRYAL